jgi:hypothetical protein
MSSSNNIIPSSKGNQQDLPILVNTMVSGVGFPLNQSLDSRIQRVFLILIHSNRLRFFLSGASRLVTLW